MGKQNFPSLEPAKILMKDERSVYIAAYGFEHRATGWLELQKNKKGFLDHAVLIKYLDPKGDNRIDDYHKLLSQLIVKEPTTIEYDLFGTQHIERILEREFSKLRSYDEVILDITAMTKLLILICLCKLQNFPGTLRIVYSEAKTYTPTQTAYNRSKKKMEEMAQFPSRGFEAILRAKCLSSIRMQGQPVVLVAFTSFNEQLIRHMLGTINPHRLIFINGRPPKKTLRWREVATQEIHSKLITEYSLGNDLDKEGNLKRATSTLDYREVVNQIDRIYDEYGLVERIIVAATGSKMQTVGLFFSKVKHPDIHIEYPTPDSYFVNAFSTGTLKVHEVSFENFKEFIKIFAQQRFSGSTP